VGSCVSTVRSTCRAQRYFASNPCPYQIVSRSTSQLLRTNICEPANFSGFIGNLPDVGNRPGGYTGIRWRENRLERSGRWQYQSMQSRITAVSRCRIGFPSTGFALLRRIGYHTRLFLVIDQPYTHPITRSSPPAAPSINRLAFSGDRPSDPRKHRSYTVAAVIIYLIRQSGRKAPPVSTYFVARQATLARPKAAPPRRGQVGQFATASRWGAVGAGKSERGGRLILRLKTGDWIEAVTPFLTGFDSGD
jgi:hypothetical protein